MFPNEYCLDSDFVVSILLSLVAFFRLLSMIKRTSPNTKLITQMGIKTENARHDITSLLEINIEKKIEEKKDSGDITKNSLYNLVNFISLPPRYYPT